MKQKIYLERLINRHMKKLFTIIFITFISGCATLSSYDGNEFEHFVQLETSVRLLQDECSNSEKVISAIPMLIAQTEVLYTYTSYTPRNTEIHQVVNILRDDMREFKTQYENGTGNETYCKLKTETILLKVNSALVLEAKKIRK